jgi:hypothetical protein
MGSNKIDAGKSNHGRDPTNLCGIRKHERLAFSVVLFLI